MMENTITETLFEELKKKIFIINENAFTKIYSQMQGKTVGVISAYNKSNTVDENIKKQSELKSFIRARGVGYSDLIGYHFDINTGTVIKQLILVVYSNEDFTTMKKWFLSIGQKYNQENVVIITDSQSKLYTKEYEDANSEYTESDIKDFSASVIADFYSNSWQDVFVFESLAPETMGAAYQRKLNADRYISDLDDINTAMKKLLAHGDGLG